MRAVSSLLLLAACGPGVGRPAMIFDAGERAEAGPIDADVFPDANVVRDAGRGDVGLFVPDSGDTTRFPFTGVFGILNASESLFAREVGDRLMLIAGRPPYIYTGTIDEDGNVDTTSGQLTRSGCAIARITGTYDRVAATYQLLHETCSSVDGTPLSSTIRGGFSQDYAGASGVYDLTATLIIDLNGCADNNQPQPVRFGVDLLSDGSVVVFAGIDVVSEPGVYVGRLTGSGFSAIQDLDVGGSQQFAMSGTFMQANANQPVMLSGERDVYSPEGGCTYRIMFDGARAESP